MYEFHFASKEAKRFDWEYPYFNEKNNFSILVCAFDMPQKASNRKRKAPWTSGFVQ